MFASHSVHSPRETRRRRSNWFSSCCGIFEEYDPVICHPDMYTTASPAIQHRVAYPSPAMTRATLVAEPRRNWLNSCCGILEDYDPVIYHPEMYSASPASAHCVNEETQVSGSLWRKNILMGGKCKMPDYSGVIIYDTAGKLVANSKPALLALPWK